MALMYLADTGTPDAKHYFICGYIASADDWTAFADDWDELRQKHLGGQPFCPFSADLQSLVLGLSNQALSEFANCIAAHVNADLWSAFPTYYLDQVEAHIGPTLRGLSISLDKFQICLANAIHEVVEQYDLPLDGDRLAWIWGRRSEENGKDPDALLTHAFNVVRKRASSNSKRFFGAFAFDDTDALNPLQAASFYAWLKMRAYAAPYEPDEPAYQILRTADIKHIGVLSSDHRVEDAVLRAWVLRYITLELGTAPDFLSQLL
jgi:hypothetical protein